MEFITSRNNKTIIETAKLKDKKHRDARGLYCFEGQKLFKEAINSGVMPVSVFVTKKTYTRLENILDTLDSEIYTVTDEVYAKLSDDRAPDGVFAVAKKHGNSVCPDGKCFILSQVRDPGNIGTCIRSARAFGINTLILHDCADPYSPKVIRSTMGAFFRQKVFDTKDILATIVELKKQGYSVYPTALNEKSTSLEDININDKTVFIVGNEGHGVSDEIIDFCSTSVIIPMRGDTESLNASVASSILMWELSK